MKKQARILAVFISWLGAMIAGVVMPAVAQASDWLVTRASQPAVYAVDSKTWRPLQAGMSIPAKSWINTGRSGRVLLQRNGDTVVIQPNSMTGVASASDASNRISIQHRAGQILLDINKGQTHRVKVRTHHLTAVVKGTQFSVSASRSSSEVSVTEGVVGVSDNATGQSADVGAGQSASSSGGGLSGSAAASSSASSASRSAARSDRGRGDRGDGRANGRGRASNKGNNGNGVGNGGGNGTGNEGNGDGNNGNGVGNGGGNGTGNEGNGDGHGDGHGGDDD
ncbi:MAG: FecR domain-containing protein [Anderseniella sp.]|nr:FecR domain-containing protein [Anderseniella sp.]